MEREAPAERRSDGARGFNRASMEREASAERGDPMEREASAERGSVLAQVLQICVGADRHVFLQKITEAASASSLRCARSSAGRFLDAASSLTLSLRSFCVPQRSLMLK
jgi:hypothetical protein